MPLGRTEEPVLLPPHGKLLLVNLKLKRLVWAPLRLWASTPPTVPEMLTAVIQRAAAMQNDLEASGADQTRGFRPLHRITER